MKYLRNTKPRKTPIKDGEEAPIAHKKPKAQLPAAIHLPAANEPPAGEDKASHTRHIKMLQMEERKLSPDKNIVADLMKRSFYYRRIEICEEPQLVQQLLKIYPSLKRCDQVHTCILQAVPISFNLKNNNNITYFTYCSEEKFDTYF